LHLGPLTVAPVTSTLTKKDLPRIKNYLNGLTNNQLKDVGLALGLYLSTLDNTNPQSLLKEMIQSWLVRADNVIDRSGPPCWESLVEALKESSMNGIADDVYKNEL